MRVRYRHLEPTTHHGGSGLKRHLRARSTRCVNTFGITDQSSFAA